nr:hypothetical protein [Tanacetum cinerariifolium]
MIPAKGFWDAVIMYYEKKTDSSRGYDSILSKWKNRILPRIGAFCAIINNVEENHESGSNDIDVYQKACVKYKMIYRQDFTLEHCYNILKDHKASGGINLNNEADEPVEETHKVQPMGRNRSKAKKKSSASSREGSSSFVDLNRELDIREAERREAAELKREEIEIQRRTLELAEREKWDRDILIYNSKINFSLPAIQQQKLQEMKDEIRERYNLDY